MFERYAEVVGTPKDPTPEHILLDFEQENFIEAPSQGAAPRTLSIAELEPSRLNL